MANSKVKNRITGQGKEKGAFKKEGPSERKTRE